MCGKTHDDHHTHFAGTNHGTSPTGCSGLQRPVEDVLRDLLAAVLPTMESRQNNLSNLSSLTFAASSTSNGWCIGYYGALPMHDVPDDMQAELMRMTWLDSQELWRIAREQMSAAAQAQLQ